MKPIHKIIIACDSFKGSCSAIDVTNYLEEGLLRVRPDLCTVKVPVADGGEGTVDALLTASGGERISVSVNDPLCRPITAAFGILPDGTAVLEMAAASGLPLLSKEERNPLIASTYGTGQLIRAALDRGCRKMILGIGGSATNDGGAGMAAALGARFFDADGGEIFFGGEMASSGGTASVGGAVPTGGAALARLSRIDCSGLDPRLRECEITVACDVTNPLCGPSGASAVYGPQKGADPEMVKQLDQALAHYADILKRDLGQDVANCPGAGAAGGLGAALMAFCHAEIRRGIDSVLDAVGFESLLSDAQLVITGEGAIDRQTPFGKVPAGVAARAKAASTHIAVIGVAGTLGAGYEKAYDCGIDHMMSIATGPLTLAECMTQAPQLLREAGERIAHLTKLWE